MRKTTRRFSVFLSTVVVIVLVATPALAHGDDEEADPVNLVEQALAIVVSTPAAADEALERIESALAVESDEPTGELEVAALELAAASIEAGDLHGAEDALVAALGSDPHAGASDPGPASEDTSAAVAGEGAGHGLTDRVDGGFRSPSGLDAAALAAAAVLAVGGFGLVFKRGRHA